MATKPQISSLAKKLTRDLVSRKFHNLNQPWRDYNYLVFDTETSGALPIGCDICEIGAVLYSGGKEVKTFQALIKPREPMSDFIIGIHGITNEMVADAQPMKDRIREIHALFQNTVAVAHHAPFDLGFMAWEFEKANLPLPKIPALCSSLLSRALIPESKDHKLQTLVKHLGIDGGQAHRALDDSRACLQVFLECANRMPPEATLKDFIAKQGKDLSWTHFSMLSLKTNSRFQAVVEATEKNLFLDMVYDGGTQKGQTRRVKPNGVVRSPDGDWLSALCLTDNTVKRFYLERIKDAQVVY